jgi:hypothetical protein
VQRRRRDHGVEPRVGERERRGLSGSEGGFDDLRAAMLASHGYAALAVACFGSRGPQAELLKVPVERIESAVEWVRGRAELDAGRISALGASKGPRSAIGKRGGEHPRLAPDFLDPCAAMLENSPDRMAHEAGAFRGKAPASQFPAFRNARVGDVI